MQAKEPSPCLLSLTVLLLPYRYFGFFDNCASEVIHIMFKEIQPRKSAVLILAIMALVVLSGCSNSNSTQDEVSPARVVTRQPYDQKNDTGQVIEDKLDAIVCGIQANQLSSNPYDYIMGSQDYGDIIGLGDEAFRYMLKSLGTSQEDGLREYIMANACAVWIGEDPQDRKWRSGKEWYNDFVSKRSEVNSGGSNQEIVDFDHICSGFIYPFNWPKLEILNDNQRIYWDRGDANFTGQAGGAVGNTNFGMNEEWVDKLRTNVVEPESEIVFKPAEVPGLDIPKLKLQRLNQDNSGSVYPLHQNTMLVPPKVGEYIFILTVDWGKGDNSIMYWFKLKVTS